MKKSLTIILEKVKAGTMEVEEALTLILSLTGGRSDFKDDVEKIIGNFETKVESFLKDASKNTDEWMDFSKRAMGTLRSDLNDFLKRTRKKNDESRSDVENNEKDVTDKSQSE
jgi:ElaB/YqjD/DUF883 family membrane-anchored ribosome-binding protein